MTLDLGARSLAFFSHRGLLFVSQCSLRPTISQFIKQSFSLLSTICRIQSCSPSMGLQLPLIVTIYNPDRIQANFREPVDSVSHYDVSKRLAEFSWKTRCGSVEHSRVQIYNVCFCFMCQFYSKFPMGVTDSHTVRRSMDGWKDK